MNYKSILVEICVLMIYVIIGYIIKRINLIAEKGIHDISKLVVNVAMPLLVVSSINIEYKPEYVRNMLIIAAATFVFLFFTSFFSSLLAKKFTGVETENKAMNYCMIFGNIGFLGYPLCYALFGQVGMLYNSVYLAIQNLFQWTVGVNIFKKKKPSLSNLKNLINPGIIGITIGLTMLFLGIRPPVIMDRVIKGIGGISIPLALMVIGATLHGHKIIEIASDRKIQLVSLFKMLVFPAVFLTGLYFIPMDNMLKSILTISAASPIQASSGVFTKNFGGDTTIAAKCVFLTTVVCMVTIPLFLMLVNV